MSAPAEADLLPPRRRHTAMWIAAVVGVLALGLVVVLATRRSAADKLADSPLLGHPAPALAGTSVLDDHTAVSTTTFAGHWGVVNFIASWCVPCRQEHPELIKFSQRHQVTGDAQLVGVLYDDSAANIRRFFAQMGGAWPVIPDPDGRIALDYGVSGVPETFLIDPNGFVAGRVVGRVTADGLDRFLAKAKARGA